MNTFLNRLFKRQPTVLIDHSFKLSMRVLLTQSGPLWVAHSVDFDLVDQGPSKEVAIDNLMKTVCAQMSFAHSMNDIDLLFFKAPEAIEARWLDANKKMAEAALRGDDGIIVDAEAMMVTIKEEMVEQAKTTDFSLMPSLATAC